MSNRLTARDRLTRLLSVIPWVARQDDGALIEDIINRFDYPRAQLLDDLQEVVFFVGVHPFTPDSLIEVEIGDERVHIRYADWFSRPLRLTPEEGARLLTAGRSVLPLTETDDDDNAGPLLRALTKLGTALGEGAADAVEVRLGHAPSDTLAILREAVAVQRQVDIEYYTYGRDELTQRRVDANRLFSDQGNWYLSGWCHRADGERVFRVDRIRTVSLSDEPNSDVAPTIVSSFSPGGDDPRVVLRLAQSARWVIEQYPVERVIEDGDHIEVTMAVTAIAWLERLLLRLGPAAEMLSVDATVPSDLRRDAAARVLARYQ
jgi:proteasome accessory factor C